MNLVEIEVRCFPSRIWIVCRILNWRKIMHIHIQRYNDNTTWVLTRCSFYTFTTFGQIYTLCLIKRLTLHLFLISFDISICRFFLYRTYSTGSKNVIISKYFFCVCMGIWLIFTREVQINIGNFIPLKT